MIHPIITKSTVSGFFLTFVCASFFGTTPGMAEEVRSESDPWGIYLTGELVVPVRDDADELRMQFGWPRRMATQVPMWGRSPAIIDIDRNGDWEIAIVNGEGRLFVFQHDGALFPGFPTDPYRGNRPEPWEDPTHRVLASVGDVDRDASPDLAFATDISHLHVVGRNQDEPNPYPLDLTRGIEASAVVSLDINNDESSELIFTTYAVRPMNDPVALLHILDAGGNELNGWPVRCGIGTGSSPAVGDIDGDNGLEIVVASGRDGDVAGSIWAFELDGSRVNGFPQGRYESIDGSVILANTDDNAGLDIVFDATPFDSLQSSLFSLNGRGEVLPGFPRLVGKSHPFGSPIVSGSNQDGSYANFSFGEYDPRGEARIVSFSRMDGGDSLIETMSIDIGVGVVGSLVSADILGGDFSNEIVAALAPTDEHDGRIVIANPDQSVMIDLADYGGGAFSSSPTLWDINRDGYTEIIAVTTDGRLYVWHTEGFFSGEIWPTERGDFARSGRKMPFQALGVIDSDQQQMIPGQFVVDSYPNPFNSQLVVNLFSSANSRVMIGLYDLKGSLVAHQPINMIAGETSRFSFHTGNIPMSSGVYLMRWSGDNGFTGSKAVIYLP